MDEEKKKHQGPDTITLTGAQLAECDRIAERWHLRRARSTVSILDDIDLQPFERGTKY